MAETKHLFAKWYRLTFAHQPVVMEDVVNMLKDDLEHGAGYRADLAIAIVYAIGEINGRNIRDLTETLK